MKLADKIVMRPVDDSGPNAPAFVNDIEHGHRELGKQHYEKLPQPIRAAVMRAVVADLQERLEKLEEIEAVKQRLSSLDAQRYSLSPEEEIRIRSMGDHFAQVWQSDHCPPTLKKMIFRTAIEEIIVRTDQDKKSLELVIHWKGGAHTQLAMERPRSATETATPVEALEIIRRMAVRYGDDQIASVLNRRGYSSGKGMRWNQNSRGDGQAQPFHCRSKAGFA